MQKEVGCMQVGQTASFLSSNLTACSAAVDDRTCCDRVRQSFRQIARSDVLQFRTQFGGNRFPAASGNRPSKQALNCWPIDRERCCVYCSS